MGLLIIVKYCELVECYVVFGLEEGGCLLCGGEWLVGDGCENGFFY